MSTLLAILLAFPSIDSAHSLVVNTTSVLHAPITSALSTATNLTTATITKSCDDIHTCRTLYSIVQTCVATIFACVWVAVHRNIPAPKPVLDPKLRLGPFKKALRWLWSKIRDLRQPVIVFSVTLLAPEWVLAWAVRQRLRAHKLAEELETESEKARKIWQENHPEDANDRSTGVLVLGSSMSPVEGGSSAASVCTGCGPFPYQCAWSNAKSVGKFSQVWTPAHGFFIIMGGYQASDEKGPICPLHPDEVVALVRDGRLVPPTGDELSNQSKGDFLSKGVAVLQTIWFVVQCIARLTVRLPLTNLEVMTLAYTVMTVAMYAAWWDKPLNVSCAIRVPGLVEGRLGLWHPSDGMWTTILFYIIGGQDEIVNLRPLQRVPTFWAGEADSNDFIKADFIALLVAMAFGAVHCIAWSYTFASHAELLMWRSSAVAVIAIPAGFLIGLALFRGVPDPPVGIYITLVFSIIGAPAYICARAILLVLSFTTLKALSYQVYQTVQWTDFIPHI
ncbi:hypothetical protein HWV62_10168 [Athelia sp. TMB]|nr:hypothetical protein HWV62_10168 [Athelia sp. TMB]